VQTTDAENNEVRGDSLVRQEAAHSSNGAASRARVVPRSEPSAGSRPDRPSLYPPWKRALDVVGALLLTIPALPLILLAALLVKLTSPGPALYTQLRVGRASRRYRIVKLRTMVHNCERDSGPRWATALDARITPIGRILRRTHIDELPQLWNVLKGEMILVGPRPERPEFVPLLAEAIPEYLERHSVRPGMTGLAQVQLPPDTDVEMVRRKLNYDLYYAHRMSFWLDLRILITTAYYLVQVPYWRVPSWLQVPSKAAIEVPEEASHPGGPKVWVRQQDTQVLPETRVVPQGRAIAR
jgi:lipopolysaccharide/colanic/teichoic acid biosynthesis glycosyltransferase